MKGGCDSSVERALVEFREKIAVATGRPALPREVESFHEQVATALAHRMARVVELGLCDFQTRDGRATCVQVTF